MGETSNMASGGMIFMSLANAVNQAEGQRSAGAYQQRIGELNAARAEVQAADAIKRGESEAAKYGRKVSGMAGSQRVSLAAQGIQIDSGSAGDIINQTYEMGAEDVQTIRNNAFREAMGYKSQASEYLIQGKLANASAQQQSSATLLAGGMKALEYGSESGLFKKSTKSEPEIKASKGTSTAGSSYYDRRGTS